MSKQGKKRERTHEHGQQYGDCRGKGGGWRKVWGINGDGGK